jgi:hypothetical protein
VPYFSPDNLHVIVKNVCFKCGLCNDAAHVENKVPMKFKAETLGVRGEGGEELHTLFVLLRILLTQRL